MVLGVNGPTGSKCTVQSVTVDGPLSENKRPPIFPVHFSSQDRSLSVRTVHFQMDRSHLADLQHWGPSTSPLALKSGLSSGVHRSKQTFVLIRRTLSNPFKKHVFASCWKWTFDLNRSISTDRFANFRHFYDGLKSLNLSPLCWKWWTLNDGSSVGEKRTPIMTSLIFISGLPLNPTLEEFIISGKVE